MKYARSTTRQSRFEESMMSLDGIMDEFEDSGKISLLSDGGAQAEGMYASLDKPREEELDIDNRSFVNLMIFEGMLETGGYGRLIPIVEQIVKNGRNRKESILSLCVKMRKKRSAAERFYDRGVRELLRFISPNKNRGETHLGKRVCL